MPQLSCEMAKTEHHKLAVWAVTPNGARLIRRLAPGLPDADVYVSQSLAVEESAYHRFERLSAAVKDNFDQYSGHIFIMATGIVVRVLAPLIQSKTSDPAVVAVDDLGKNAISLLSGHIGGANDLTRKVASIIKANPVITTATDVNRVPAIDVLAGENGLAIENPGAIKNVNMALVKKAPVDVHDPYNYMGEKLLNLESASFQKLTHNIQKISQPFDNINNPIVYIDDAIMDLPPQALILRPPSLVAGIGCNRGTDSTEIGELLSQVLASNRLALPSLACIASIDVKKDEAGLIETAKGLGLPLIFFKREELNQVKGIQNPSQIVEKHVGAKSVCEAAAILGSRNGTLIVPKNSTKNVTVAIARTGSLSSE
jgi:cobalt-precorrin 5A hydrolase